MCNISQNNHRTIMALEIELVPPFSSSFLKILTFLDGYDYAWKLRVLTWGHSRANDEKDIEESGDKLREIGAKCIAGNGFMKAWSDSDRRWSHCCNWLYCGRDNATLESKNKKEDTEMNKFVVLTLINKQLEMLLLITAYRFPNEVAFQNENQL